MQVLLALTLALAPQAVVNQGPLAPSAPAAPTVQRLRAYDPWLVGTPNGRYFELELNTADGPERFGLYAPMVPAAAASPLLVHFHAFGGGNFELVTYADDMLAEADARGWFVVAPEQEVRNPSGLIDGRTYGSDEAQRRVQAVLDWALTTLPVDPTRVYGYGFSMGGGDCLAYAAQHLDPTRGAFAALVNHTGTLVLTEEWTRNPSARPALEAAFGGTPASARYAYERAASLGYSWSPTSNGGFLANAAHPARNLAATPTRSWFHVGDTLYQRAEAYMYDLDTLVFDHTIIYQPTQLPQGGNTPPAHAWEYLDANAACNWFATHTLTVPSSGSLVIARDARYHHLVLTRKTNTDFGRVTFQLPQGSNAITLASVANLQRVRVDAAVSGLSTAGGSLLVTVGRDTHPSYLGRPVVVEVQNLGFAPSVVRQLNSTPSAQPTWTVTGGVAAAVSTATGTTSDVLEFVR